MRPTGQPDYWSVSWHMDVTARSPDMTSWAFARFTIRFTYSLPSFDEYFCAAANASDEMLILSAPPFVDFRMYPTRVEFFCTFFTSV